jgi:uronate dehydrogenase
MGAPSRAWWRAKPEEGALAQRKKVLINGATGRIGGILAHYLKDRYDLRLSGRRPVEGFDDSESVIAEIADYDQVLASVRGVDAVIHMAANPSVDPEPTREVFADIRDRNLQGTYNVYEACRQAGVGKIVFASTNHVVGMYEKDRYANVTTKMDIRPDSLYGASKAFGEALGRMYSDRYGISIICLRIGNVGPDYPPKKWSRRLLSAWFSHPDCAQLHALAIETDLRYGIFYGVSGNHRRFWDISDAQELLGYKPQDDSERYAHLIED